MSEEKDRQLAEKKFFKYTMIVFGAVTGVILGIPLLIELLAGLGSSGTNSPGFQDYIRMWQSNN